MNSKLAGYVLLGLALVCFSTIGLGQASVSLLSDDDVKAALEGRGKDHYALIYDNGLMAAQGAALPHITLFMPDSLIAFASANATKQFLSYAPSESDRQQALTIVAQGYVGSTYQEGCDSITRVVLLSSPSGGVVEEAYASKASGQAWANGFGATNYCQSLASKFSMESVRRVRDAADNVEFYVAVFAGSRNTKIYKIKRKYQKWGWNECGIRFAPPYISITPFFAVLASKR